MSLNIGMKQTIAYFYAAKEKLIVTCLSIPISYIRMCKFSRVTKPFFSSRFPAGNPADPRQRVSPGVYAYYKSVPRPRLRYGITSYVCMKFW